VHAFSDTLQGINRLGRGTAKPGTLRPTDPNRFKTEDFFSVDAEADPEYIRRVVEVEQLAAHKQGCVTARGGALASSLASCARCVLRSTFIGPVQVACRQHGGQNVEIQQSVCIQQCM
jgi:hypothetical protein